MGLVKVITKADIKKAKKDLNLREEFRIDAIRAEINSLLATGNSYFDYSERKDLNECDIKMILQEYKRYSPEIRCYRQPGEDIAEIHFKI